MMNRPVMAGEAFLVADFFVKKSHRGRVACRTLSGEHRVRGRQGPSRIHAAVFANPIPRDPQDGEGQGRDGKQKSPMAQRALPLEIIEVDSLRKFLSCPCSRQEWWSSSFAIRKIHFKCIGRFVRWSFSSDMSRDSPEGFSL
jgi:hypothetical protein